MRRISVGILAASSAALTILLASCGSPSLPVKALDQQAAAQMTGVGATGDAFVASMMSPGGFSPAAVGAQALGTATVQPVPQATTTCTTKTGDATDADNDHWSVNLKVTYDCHSSSTYGSSSITGSVSEHDYDDQDALSGYEAHINDLSLSGSSSGSSYNLTENMDWVLTRGAPGNYALDYNFSIDMSSSGGSSSTSGYFALDGKPTYVADSPSSPFASGTFTFDGKVTFEDSGARYVVTRKSTAGGVHYNDSCSGFDSGSVVYHDQNGGGSATVTYTSGCSYNVNYSGF